MVCGKTACSTERNGPTSLPEGLIVPSTAATLSMAKLSVSAKTAPARAINAAPMIRTRLRPYWSATVVKNTVITAPPARAAVNTMPMATASRPIAAR